MVAFYKARKHLARVADPDRTDPARHFWLFKAALLAVLIAVYGGIVATTPPDLRALLAVSLALVGVILYFCSAMYVNFRAALHRRATGYVISYDSYKHAPRSIQVSMRRIYKSAASIEGGRAHRDGMFGDIEVTRLVYSAASRAVLSSELAESARDLICVEGFAASSEETRLVQARLKSLASEVQAVEKSLGRAKKAESQLSSDLEELDRAAVKQRTNQTRQQQRVDTIKRIDEVTARIDATTTLDARDIEDRVTSVHAGYKEAEAITRQAEHSLASEPDAENATTVGGSHVVARTAWRAAKSTAFGAGRLSKSAARLGFSAVEKRRSHRSTNS